MYAPEPKKPLFERIQERLAASRFLTFSALLHAVLIFLGGGVVLYKQATDVPDFEAGGDLVAADSQVAAPPEPPPDLTQQQFTPQTPTLSAPTLSAISTTNLSTPKFEVAAAFPAALTAPADDSMKSALQSAAKNVGKGLSMGIPGTMSARVGGTARTKAMEMNGGKKASEEAVLKGLKWLVANQNPDGSWGKAFRPAMTGFGLLAFLGHGETPVSPEFGPTIQKALDWILANGKKHDGRLSMEDVISGGGTYSHAIVTYALGEYYTMTKDERVSELLKKAIDYILKGQAPDDGGWTYFHGTPEELGKAPSGYNNTRIGGNVGSDTSVTGWQIQALKAAHLTGLNIDGVDAALDKAMLDLQRVRGPKGGYGYIAKSDTYGLTGVGILCTYFWKQEKDDSIRKSVAYMMEETEKNFPVKYKNDNANLYAWYYDTQACLMVGGAAWNTWNHWFQDELVKNQAPDGSWPPLTGKAPGSDLQKDPNNSRDGAFYRTNLCILMLEVYYRYMPTTK